MNNDLPLLPGFMQAFVLRWASKRQPESQQQIQITRDRLYILPTRHGLLFFIVLLLVLLGAINYENSLGFMLAFLLGALGLIDMIYTHQNLNGLSISSQRAEPVFAGQDILFPLRISQTSAAMHPAIQLVSSHGKPVQIDLLKQLAAECKLSVNASQRGYVSMGRVKIFSEFPLGLFHAWSWLSLDSQCLVYPAPATETYPVGQDQNTTIENISQASAEKQGVDDFYGIREYQQGDQPHHMAWKAIAKTGQLQTKLFSQQLSDEIWLNWSELNPALDTEKKLSILCRMVLDADKQSAPYGLILPGINISPGCGLQHKHHCLKALALFAL